MLFHDLKSGQSIVIIDKDGQQIKITIVETKRRIARIGVEAPENLKVLRSELNTNKKEN